MKAIIFDFDGVIHDTFDFHRYKIKEFCGVDIPEDDFRDMHNGNFFKNKVPVDGIQWTDYRDYILPFQSKLEIDEERKEIIETLSKNHDMFIVTSGGTENILGYLENNGLGGIFKEILGLEASRSKVVKFNTIFEKHSLEPHECVFITDTLGDILEANKVNVKTIAVTYGFHTEETLQLGNPHCLISQPYQLFNALTCCM